MDLAERLLDSTDFVKLKQSSTCEQKQENAIYENYVPPMFRGSKSNSEAYLSQLHHIEEKINHLETALENKDYLNTIALNSTQSGGKKKNKKTKKNGQSKKI